MSEKFRLILLFVLLIISHQSLDNYNQYEITPTLPPIAFVGQYYTVNFRVSGLTAPTFTFDNLPSCFNASGNGEIQGTPNKSGSYSIRVNYKNDLEYGQKDLVLRVSEPDYSSSASLSQGTSKPNINWIQLAIPSIYQVGSKISVNLNKNAKDAPYTWSYLQIPEQIEADPQGNLKGTFYAEGYYSFGATCFDAKGNSRDYFFTFNIQPQNYLSSRARTYVQVPNRNVFRYDAAQVQALENEANSNVEKAQKAWALASAQLGQIKGSVSTTQSNVVMAQAQVNAVEKIVSLALNQKAKQFNIATELEAKLDKANNIYNIKKTAYDQSVTNTNYIQNILKFATTLFNKLNQIFQAINQKFIDAQNASTQAAADLSLAQKNVGLAKEDINLTFKGVLDAKKFLQDVQNKNSMVDFNVNSASDQRDIANFQNDATTTAYNTASKGLQKALGDLKNANSTVFELLQAKQEAKNYLGQAQFNLVQAMNALYVAQAAKAQSDKALLIASAQSSIIPQGTSTYIFSGCDIGNYPVISGTATISKSSKTGYELSSGYTLIYGNCTQGVAANQGDTVNFSGYLRNGCIHGVKIDKN